MRHWIPPQHWLWEFHGVSEDTTCQRVPDTSSNSTTHQPKGETSRRDTGLRRASFCTKSAKPGGVCCNRHRPSWSTSSGKVGVGGWGEGGGNRKREARDLSLSVSLHPGKNLRYTPKPSAPLTCQTAPAGCRARRRSAARLKSASLRALTGPTARRDCLSAKDIDAIR